MRSIAIAIAIAGLVGACTLLVGVSAAAAGGTTRPDDRAGARGPGAIAAATEVVRPDDRAGRRSPGASGGINATRPDDRSGARGPGAFVPSGTAVPAVEVRVDDSGLDWPSFAAGAGGALTLVLVAAAAAALRPGRGTRPAV